MGPAEILALLMTLAGFGVDENPNAPSADDVLSMAPARAEYMLHLDLVGVVPNNYRRLIALPDHPSVAKQPDAKLALKQLVDQAEMVRGMVRGATGLDPVTDITSITAWVQVPDAGDPNILMVVRGNIPNDLVARIASADGVPTSEVAGRTVMSPDADTMVGMSASGVLLAGSKTLVQPRLAAKFKRERNSAIETHAKPLLQGATFVAASVPSKRWVRRLESELGSDEDTALLTDLATGHEFLGIAVRHDGVDWTAVARTKTGHRRARRASEGVIDAMRAMHHGSRGLARLFLAAAPSYAGFEPVAEAIAKHQDDIMKLVEATTGDGNFEATVDEDAARRTVRVRARGKSLSDVMPAAGLLPIAGGAAAFFLISRGEAEAMPPTAVEAVPAKAPKPPKSPKSPKPSKPHVH
jgi:hypothetical protein